MRKLWQMTVVALGFIIPALGGENQSGIDAPAASAPSAGRTDLLYLSHVHRGGGKKESPDNTLPTFLWRWEHGSGVECDCRRTRDGVGIMLHDPTLKRTARGITPEMAKKQVSKELTYAEIKDVDVGSYLGKQFASHRIPTIEEVFNAMKGHPKYLCFVDEKGATPEYIAQKAIAAGVQDQVYYTGSSHDNIFKWNKILPGGKSLLWLGIFPKTKNRAERRAVTDPWMKKKNGGTPRQRLQVYHGGFHSRFIFSQR